MLLDSFIKRIEDTPAEWFALSSEDDNRTVWEMFTLEEGNWLWRVVRPFGLLISANDGVDGYDIYGDTPKERVLMFLKQIRAERITVHEES